MGIENHPHEESRVICFFDPLPSRESVDLIIENMSPNFILDRLQNTRQIDTHFPSAHTTSTVRPKQILALLQTCAVEVILPLRTDTANQSK